MSKDLTVNYNGSPCYEIKIRNTFEDLPGSIRKLEGANYNRICIVSDSNVSNLYLDKVKACLNEFNFEIYDFVFEAGEASKNLTVVEKLYEKLIISRFDRHDLLIALGGGVVGDLTGFTAATYLRGIDFIQIPTSLLSQVDSSIGGKTGVDFSKYKNMVGAFYMPRLVYINTEVHSTLPDRQFASGMAEIIKHGLLADKDYYVFLKDNYKAIMDHKPEALEEMIYGSCKIKRAVVEEDPTEKGIRGTLNLGHTIGHAVEKLSNFELYHGECVAIGTVAAAYLSTKRNCISCDELEDIKATITSYNLPISADNISADEVLAATKSDKKMVGNKIKFILIESIGKAIIDTSITDQEILDAINYVLK